MRVKHTKVDKIEPREAKLQAAAQDGMSPLSTLGAQQAAQQNQGSDVPLLVKMYPSAARVPAES